MIGIADPARAETDLAAGTLACPGCTRPLHPWGHARTRTVRDHGHATLALRPRRARCRTCRVTHVRLPCRCPKLGSRPLTCRGATSGSRA